MFNNPMPNNAIILLNNKGLKIAKQLQEKLPGTVIWGLEGRVDGADKSFTNTGEHIRTLFAGGTTLIGIMATGILIRALAPILNSKRSEPPVLALSDDGQVVIPLLGGLTGANELAQKLSALFNTTPALTASGARHLAVQLEAPPSSYHLANPKDAKRITSDILSGKKVQLEGHCPWLENSQIPFEEEGEILLKVTPFQEDISFEGLLYHPKSVLVAIEDATTTTDEIIANLEKANLTREAMAVLTCPPTGPIATAKICATALNVPLRLLNNIDDLVPLFRETFEKQITIVALQTPIEAEKLGDKVGKLSVLGLGPGPSAWRTPEVSAALEQAEILVGYETYINMVPTKEGQQRLASSNRVEAERAKEALDLAAKGHHVAVVSSGDPGIFAMASAVIEVMDQTPERWSHIDFEVLPGLSAMQAAAARIGAPLGHDFAVISLSDILKPFEIIEQRLISAARSDMVIAIYNPASKTRRAQIQKVQELLLQEKTAETPVLIAKNVGRDGETIFTTTLEEIKCEEIDMRTLLIIGSSKTRVTKGPDGKPLMYTPRSYQ